MKNMQVLSMVAAASLIAGCSSTQNSDTLAGSGSPHYRPQMTWQPTTHIPGDVNSDYGATASTTAEPKPMTGADSTGLLGKRSEVTFDQLPQAAQQTVRNQIGQAQISKIKEVTKDGQTTYKIELARNSWHATRPSLTVAADGSVLRESHMEKITEASGAQNNPQNEEFFRQNGEQAQPGSSSSMGSQTNPSGATTNSAASNPQNQ